MFPEKDDNEYKKLENDVIDRFMEIHKPKYLVTKYSWILICFIRIICWKVQDNEIFPRKTSVYLGSFE